MAYITHTMRKDTKLKRIQGLANCQNMIKKVMLYVKMEASKIRGAIEYRKV